VADEGVWIADVGHPLSLQWARLSYVGEGEEV